MDKVCFKCGHRKLLSEFYKHKQTRDGHLNKCKQCSKVDAKKHREDNLEIIKEYDRNRPNKLIRDEVLRTRHKEGMKDPAYRAKVQSYKRTWIERNPERHAPTIQLAGL